MSNREELIKIINHELYVQNISPDNIHRRLGIAVCLADRILKSGWHPQSEYCFKNNDDNSASCLSASSQSSYNQYSFSFEHRNAFVTNRNLVWRKHFCETIQIVRFFFASSVGA